MDKFTRIKELLEQYTYTHQEDPDCPIFYKNVSPGKTGVKAFLEAVHAVINQ